jgi:FtsP/CotA-like multicopper oxidase with cupredoxin domain
VRIAIFGALAVLLLAGLWGWLQPPAAPATLPEAVSSPQASAPVAAAIPIPPAPQRFSLSAPLPIGTVGSVLRVQAGDSVEITVTSAKDDELHLHGYDLALQLRGGEPGTLRFVAEHAGRFEIELHRGHSEIAVLEVSPR